MTCWWSVVNTIFAIHKKKIQHDATMCQILLFHIYMKLSIFRPTHHPSTLCLTMSTNYTYKQPSTVLWKTRGCQCSFRLLMMGGVSPKTCWTSYKYGIIKVDTLLHLVGFFFMNCTMMHGSTNVKPKPSVLFIMQSTYCM
jgi:hypothetical protein